MSDNSKSNSGEWQMPEPVFQSSEGHTPKAAPKLVTPDEIDTAAPDFSEADTDEIITDVPVPDQDEIDTETPEFQEETETVEEDAVEKTPAAAPTNLPSAAKPGGCFQTIGIVAGIIAVSAAAILITLVYYLFIYRPSDTSF